MKNLKQEYDKKIEQLEENLSKITSSPMPNLGSTKEDGAIIEKSVKAEHHSTSRAKAPKFDGKSAWSSYLRQFEIAAKMNGWSSEEKASNLTLSLQGEALNIIQTVKPEDQENYELLVKQLDMRYGNAHLQQVYQAQLNNRNQESKETLQEFEADISRLVHLAFPDAPENMIQALAIQRFIQGMRDSEIQQALRIAHTKTLSDALSIALEHEAAKQASRNQSRVRNIDAEKIETNEDLEERMRRILKEILPERRKLRCWNCGELGHPQRLCKKFPRKTDIKKEEDESEN